LTANGLDQRTLTIGPPRGTSLKIPEPDSAIVVMYTISPTSGIRHHSGNFALTAKAMLIESRP
jgi:hypothetical protein